jgi:hypothetical protein
MTHPEVIFAVQCDQKEMGKVERSKARLDTAFNINYREPHGAYLSVVCGARPGLKYVGRTNTHE